MFTTIRSIFINDDKNTFTCVFPSLYSIFSISPFKVIYSKSLKSKNLTIGSAATCCGWRFLALSGLPADPYFDMRSVLIRDHSKLSKESNGKDDEIDIFSHIFNQNILSFRITPDFLICGFYNHVEIWHISRSEQISNIIHGVNFHAPLCSSSDFMMFACTGPTNVELSFLQLKGEEEIILDSANDNDSVQVSVSGTVKTADDPITIIKFSPDNQLLALASSSGYTIQILRTDTYSVIAKFKCGRSATVIYSLDFSPNSDFLISISQKSVLNFFDLRKVLKSHQIQPKPPVDQKFIDFKNEIKIDIDGTNYEQKYNKNLSPKSSNPSLPKSMPSHVTSSPEKVKIASEKVIFSKSFAKITLDEFNSISSISWFNKNQIAVVSHDGKLLLMTINEENCNEIGRESIIYKNYIQDALYANA